jgi:Tfp pilus assembly protein PilX
MPLTETLRAACRRRGTDERGSLVVALMIILVCFTLGSALVMGAIAGDKTALNNQHHDTALEAAQAGVADALFRLDQLPDTGTPSSFCVAATPSVSCLVPVAGGVPGIPGVSYSASFNPSANAFTIRSEAVVGNTDAAVQATATRASQFPFALFGNSGLTFNGNASNGFDTYDEAAYSTSPSSPNPNPEGPVAIGSNGSITCNGPGLASNVTAEYYSGGGGISGSCGTASPQPTQISLPVPSAPTSYSDCPNDGQLGADYGYPTIAPGTYLCTSPITIGGALAVAAATTADPVKIYVILPAGSNTSSTTAVAISSDAVVNAQTSYTAGEPLPVAGAFQILSNATGEVGGSNGQGYVFGGIIDAPNAYLVGDGCKSVYYGALVLNTLTCNGGPHLAVHYDDQLGQLYTAWSISGYTDIPANDVGLASLPSS